MGRTPIPNTKDETARKLLGKKIQFLRTEWGFKSREMLAKDKRWHDMIHPFSHTLAGPGMGVFERGVRELRDDAISAIAEAYSIDEEVLKDECPFEEFKEKALLTLHVHRKLSVGVTLERNIAQAQLRETVIEWEKKGYSYSYIRDNWEAFIHHTDKDSSELDVITCKKSLAFLMMVAIYKKTDWRKWTIKNKDNEIALQALFEVLLSLHYRTRFRAFYAMQFFSKHQISKMLEHFSNRLEEKIKTIVKEYVLNNKVVDFIEKCSMMEDRYIAEKAKEVLSELAFIWNEEKIKKIFPF